MAQTDWAIIRWLMREAGEYLATKPPYGQLHAPTLLELLAFWTIPRFVIPGYAERRRARVASERSNPASSVVERLCEEELRDTLRIVTNPQFTKGRDIASDIRTRYPDISEEKTAGFWNRHSTCFLLVEHDLSGNSLLWQNARYIEERQLQGLVLEYGEERAAYIFALLQRSSREIIAGMLKYGAKQIVKKLPGAKAQVEAWLEIQLARIGTPKTEKQVLATLAEQRKAA